MYAVNTAAMAVMNAITSERISYSDNGLTPLPVCHSRVRLTAYRFDLSADRLGNALLLF